MRQLICKNVSGLYVFMKLGYFTPGHTCLDCNFIIFHKSDRTGLGWYSTEVFQGSLQKQPWKCSRWHHFLWLLNMGGFLLFRVSLHCCDWSSCQHSWSRFKQVVAWGWAWTSCPCIYPAFWVFSSLCQVPSAPSYTADKFTALLGMSKQAAVAVVLTHSDVISVGGKPVASCWSEL